MKKKQKNKIKFVYKYAGGSKKENEEALDRAFDIVFNKVLENWKPKNKTRPPF